MPILIVFAIFMLDFFIAGVEYRYLEYTVNNNRLKQSDNEISILQVKFD